MLNKNLNAPINKLMDIDIISENKTKSKCPYQHNVDKIIGNKNENKINNLLSDIQNHKKITDVALKSKCPVDHSEITNIQRDVGKENSEEADNVENSGCPMLNKVYKEQEEIFSYYFEIPFDSPYEYIFKSRGAYSKKEFIEKTTKLRLMPRHLRYTLFHLKEEKLLLLHKKEFPYIYFAYEELREKAYKLYRKKEYRQALKYYYFIYCFFKWLEFKDDNREKDILNAKNIIPILDQDIEEKILTFTDNPDTYEEDCMKTCLVTILKQMSLCYMHLRHFSEAISSLDEAISYSNDKVPELYLRRSQARTYNKFNNKDQLEKALCDINIAIKIDPVEYRFQIHLKILTELINENDTKETERTEKLIRNAKYSFTKISDKKLNLNDYVYSSYDHIETNSKILDEMMNKYKDTLKFHNETNNQKQIDLAYKEMEDFFDVYYKFKWYYSFDVDQLPDRWGKILSAEER